MNVIDLSHLTRSYGKARGVTDISLQVKEGEFFGLIGPNGAGKSTIIRSLLGLIAPTDGNIHIFNKDISHNREAILQNVGYLPSEAIFYPGMKVKDLLKLSASLRKKDCRKEAENLCRRLQLDPDKKVEELSFGNRKKAGIICALQHNPPLLILDEPTSGLDPLMQREFFALLKERHEQGATILLSSHILSEIRQHCSRAAILSEGKLIAVEDMDTLAATSARQVVVWQPIRLEGLTGIHRLEQNGSSLRFLYTGPMKELLERILESNVDEFTISEPSAEELFLHYYDKKEGESA